jgi:pimeloyl-ACP methyl ester carboxylesterase
VGLLSDNEMWEGMGSRALALVSSGGAEIGECQAAVAAVGDGGSAEWHDAWNSLAQRLEDQGRVSATEGDRMSARESLMRASTYYRISYAPLFGSPVDERLRISFEAEERAFSSAADLGTGNLRALEIPFEGGSLPAYLATADDTGEPRPTILQVNGYDSNVHEMYFSNGPAAVARGYNWIGFDGPGQGRNLIRDGLHLRPDWESVLGPVLDFVEKLEEVDPEKIVLMGWSLGGFLAPRAAAFHSDRLAALVADPGQFDLGVEAVAQLPLDDEEKQRFPDAGKKKVDGMEEWLRGKDAPPMLKWKLIDRGLWVNGAASLFEYFVDMTRYEMSPVAAGITCPTLVTAAEGDGIGAGEQLIGAISGPGELVTFTAAQGAAGHCEGLGRAVFHGRLYDWLSRTLR